MLKFYRIVLFLVYKINYMFLFFLSLGIFFTHFVLAASASGPVRQTGQTTSYVAGDDGDLKKGVVWPTPRFIDIGDGTVHDELTGLIWMKNAACWGTLSWADALTKVSGLNAGTQSCAGYATGIYNDWRLPNIHELLSLIDSSNSNLPSGHMFSNAPSTYASAKYWSSTTYASTTTSAWTVDFRYGYVSDYDKTGMYSVWPVRDGQ
ncbi:MAG: DUF1566 domain-containing protein [Magnetococcales bacterium]|nr:DUF1566 domain-containing protein [Magnetococcales bacterium]